MANEIIPSEKLIGKTRSALKAKVFSKLEVVAFCKKNNMKCIYDNKTKT